MTSSAPADRVEGQCRIQASNRLRPAGAADGERIRRLVACFIGAGYLAHLIVTVAESGRVAATVAPWWTPAAAIVVIGPGLALLLAALGVGPARERRIRFTAAAALAGYAAATVGWWLAWTGETVAGPTSTWLARFSGLVGLCAALIIRPMWVGAIQLAATVSASLINQMALASPHPIWSRVAAESTWALGFTGVFVAAGVMAIHTSRVLDDTREIASRAADRTAALTAREHERGKFDALIHDRVIAVLLEASRTTDPQQLSVHAHAALTALDDLATPPVAESTLTAVQVRDLVLDAVLEVNSTVIVSAHDTATATAQYSVAAATAITAAAAEAVRNSRVHAGSFARTRVCVDIDNSRIRITVTDDGRGFDPRTVAPSRLGITGSIAGRMNGISGGRSTIATDIDEGTTVTLEWARPTPDPPAESSPRRTALSRDILNTSSTADRGSIRGRQSDETISAVVGLHSTWAVAVATSFLVCAAVAAYASVRSGMTPFTAIGSLAVLTVGIGVVVTSTGDPMNRWAAALCAGTAPLHIVVAMLGLPEPEADPVRNAAAVSGGLVVCAFVCVRGRAGWAWAGQVGACSVFAAWSLQNDVGLQPLVQICATAAAVMTMATVFAALLRPAVRKIFTLRAERVAQSAAMAAARAALTQRRRQSERLNELARPILHRLTRSPALSHVDSHYILLLEARLRDSIRARALDTPDITQAVWNARDRGVRVSLFDDGGADTAPPDTTARLQHFLLDHVTAATSGQVTIRIAPPHRETLATIVISDETGATRRFEYNRTMSTQ